MKRGLQLLAGALAIATTAFWLAKGAHTGWSQDRIQVKTVDPVTELEQIEWQDKYVPGLNVLGGGLALAGALLGGSLFLRPKNKPQQNQTS